MQFGLIACLSTLGYITSIIIHWTLYLFSDWPKACSDFSKSAPVTSSTGCRLYNIHVKDTQGYGWSCHVWPRCMISKGNHVKFARFVLPPVSEGLRFLLITATSTLIILDITKTLSNNCSIILTKATAVFFYFFVLFEDNWTSLYEVKLLFLIFLLNYITRSVPIT